MQELTPKEFDWLKIKSAIDKFDKKYAISVEKNKRHKERIPDKRLFKRIRKSL
jgi:hypothetical protein